MFQPSPNPEILYETSDLIGQALQQEPISKSLSCMFGMYTFLAECDENGYTNIWCIKQ